MQLGHHFSVDLYVEQWSARARLVVAAAARRARLLALRRRAVVAACAAPRHPACTAARRRSARPGAERLEHIALRQACHRLWHYLVRRRPGATPSRAARYAASPARARDEPWREPAPLLRAGLYWPGMLRPDLDDGARPLDWSRRPWLPIVFYRALVQSGDLGRVDALIDGADGARAATRCRSLRQPQGSGCGAPLVRDFAEQARRRDPERDRLPSAGALRRPTIRCDQPTAGPAGRVLRRRRGGLARRHTRPLGRATWR